MSAFVNDYAAFVSLLNYFRFSFFFGQEDK